MSEIFNIKYTVVLHAADEGCLIIFMIYLQGIECVFMTNLQLVFLILIGCFICVTTIWLLLSLKRCRLCRAASIRKLFSVVADYEIFPFKVDDISPNYRYYVSHTSIRRSSQPVSVSRYCLACFLRQGEFYKAKGVNGCFVLWHVLRIYFPRSRKVDLIRVT